MERGSRRKRESPEVAATRRGRENGEVLCEHSIFLLLSFSRSLSGDLTQVQRERERDARASTLTHRTFMSSLALPDTSALRATLADGAFGAWRLTRSTGKAAWIAVSSFLVLVVPLIIELDREQQLVEFEAQQLGALTGGQQGTGAPAAK